MIWKLIALWLLLGIPAWAADQNWQTLDHVPPEKQKLKAWIRPEKARAFSLRTDRLEQALARVPLEGATPVEISLPMPDGALARFAVVESPVMAPELARKFPRIKTYLGRGVDDPAASVRFDWTPAGFHAQILSPRGAVYIDPFSQGDTETYTSYYKRDYRREADGFICLVQPNPLAAQPQAAAAVAERSGPTLRTYRLACAATGEYTAFHGGTVEAGMAAIVTAVNRVTGVYEIETAIRMVLVANNDLLVYTNSGTDPYTNSNGARPCSAKTNPTSTTSSAAPATTSATSSAPAAASLTLASSAPMAAKPAA